MSDYSSMGLEHSDNNVLLLETIGAAIVDVDEEQASALYSTVANDAILSVDPEPIFFAFEPTVSADEDGRLVYMRGFRDAVSHLCDAFSDNIEVSAAMAVSEYQDSNAFTWGLTALGIGQSPLSGKGVRVAVLDTGMDLDHPDFADRTIEHQSFIPNQSVKDLNGHGTHCIGTACGPRNPESGRGYGIAYESDIYVGKVLSNQGSSLGRSTLAGIEWAMKKKVNVISLSLGARVAVGQRPLPAFENAGAAAVERGILIVAAAGNDSRRSHGEIEPVGSPANCPSFMAVAAVDPSLKVADFSNGGLNPNGGQVEISGPGVEVYSSSPEPAGPRQPPFFRQWSPRYDTIGGTSMATPHVAGVAALLKEANPNASAAELRRRLVEGARKLPGQARDVGAGLVQAPLVASPNGTASVRVFG